MPNILLKKMDYKLYERKAEEIDNLVFKGCYIQEGYNYKFAYAKIAELGNGHPVGFYICKYIDKKHISLHTLAVLFRYRNKGIGTKLLKDAITSAKRRGIKTICLDVRIGNKKAQKLYEKHKFEILGMIEDKFIVMRLNLRKEKR